MLVTSEYWRQLLGYLARQHRARKKRLQRELSRSRRPAIYSRPIPPYLFTARGRPTARDTR